MHCSHVIHPSQMGLYLGQGVCDLSVGLFLGSHHLWDENSRSARLTVNHAASPATNVSFAISKRRLVNPAGAGMLGIVA
jgi:hypothetical protein